ncbi:MAG: DUF1295 domain-containing protein [Myxococcota bacterium]
MRGAVVALVALSLCLSLAFIGDLGRPAGATALWVFVAMSFGLQWVAFVPAVILRTERFYDLMGTVGYLTLTAAALASTELDFRKLAVALAVAIWGLRLGSFLFLRIHRDGKDRRFDQIKINPPRFFAAWSLQATWVFITLLAVLLVLLRPSQPEFRITDVLGMGLWAVGFGIEATADAQKRAFRAREENAGRFISTGLWAWSRHPNYFGEILLWTGLAVVGAGVFQGSEWIGWVSPLFVTLLLLRISGVPTLEKEADRRWGDDPDYARYKAATPVLVPRPPQARETV